MYTKAKFAKGIEVVSHDMPTPQHFSQHAVIDGLILAGGQSRRMGGRDKAALTINGRSLLAHHIVAMQDEVQVLWLAGRQPDDLPVSRAHCIDDVYPGCQGPLSGMAAALQQSRADWLWLVSCDSFGVDGRIRQALWQAACESRADIVHVSTHKGEQPLLALIHTGLARDLLAFLQQGERSVLAWYRRHHTVTVALDSAGLHCNINTPADFEQLVLARQ